MNRIKSYLLFFRQVDIPSCFVGLILENCQLPYANYGHVVLADPSPILFYPISSTEIRCLVDVPGQKVPSISGGEMAHYLKTKVAPQVCISALHIVCFGAHLLISGTDPFRSDVLFVYLTLWPNHGVCKFDIAGSS